MTMSEPRYDIVRFYEDDDRDEEVIKRDVTLAEAKAHCSDPASEGDGWFDGFRAVP